MKGATAFFVAVLLAGGVQAAAVDCGPKRTGMVLKDGCDEERRLYCTSMILPNPPGWTGEQTRNALRRLEACLESKARGKPEDDRGNGRPSIRH